MMGVAGYLSTHAKAAGLIVNYSLHINCGAVSVGKFGIIQNDLRVRLTLEKD